MSPIIWRPQTQCSNVWSEKHTFSKKFICFYKHACFCSRFAVRSMGRQIMKMKTALPLSCELTPKYSSSSLLFIRKWSFSCKENKGMKMYLTKWRRKSWSNFKHFFYPIKRIFSGITIWSKTYLQHLKVEHV